MVLLTAGAIAEALGQRTYGQGVTMTYLVQDEVTSC